MKYELDLMRGAVEPEQRSDPVPQRRAIREATDALIHDALLQNDLPGLVEQSAHVMCTVAATLLRRDLEPQVVDLVDAARGLIEHARTTLDRGLMLADAPTILAGSVQVELVVRGIAASLSVPYDAVLYEVARATKAGEAPVIRPLLESAGLVAPAD